jgi:hypothetical protein
MLWRIMPRRHNGVWSRRCGTEASEYWNWKPSGEPEASECWREYDCWAGVTAREREHPGCPWQSISIFFCPDYPVRHRTAIATEGKPAAPPLRSSYMVSPSSPALGKDESRGIGGEKIKIKVLRLIQKLFLRETSCP